MNLQDAKGLSTLPPTDARQVRISKGSDSSALAAMTRSFHSRQPLALGIWRRGLDPASRAYTQWLETDAPQAVFKALHALHYNLRLEKRDGRIIVAASRYTPERVGLDYRTALNGVLAKDERPCLRQAFIENHLQIVTRIFDETGVKALSCGETWHDRYTDTDMSQGAPYEYFHQDQKPKILLHYSDPGTVYTRKKMMAADTPHEPNAKSLFRTAAGDVTIHGASVWHAFPSRRPQKNQPNEGLRRVMFGMDLVTA